MSAPLKEAGFSVTQSRLAFVLSLVAAISILYSVIGAYYDVRNDAKVARVEAQEAKQQAAAYMETSNKNNDKLAQQIQSLSETINNLALAVREVQTLQRADQTGPRFERKFQ